MEKPCSKSHPRRGLKLSGWLTLIGVLLFLPSVACTCFVLRDASGHLHFGKNFDFPIPDGHIHVNYCNAKKTAFIQPPEVPLTWVSTYGSITFNQAGREFPYGGMNEAGLVIEQMWLEEASYPPADHRYGLQELQWIQYQLDHAATVQEVLDSDTLVRISYMATSRLHFLVADAMGHVAVIEYINGERLVRQAEQLPHPVLTNCPYERSLAYTKSTGAHRKEAFNAWTHNSSGRFAKAVEMIDAYQGEPIHDYAFSILDSVYQPGSTQWSLLYDLRRLRISYTSALNGHLQTIDLQNIDFHCREAPLYLPLQEEFAGSESFHKLSPEENLRQITTIIHGIEFLRNSVPQAYIDASAQYHQSVKCAPWPVRDE